MVFKIDIPIEDIEKAKLYQEGGERGFNQGFRAGIEAAAKVCDKAAERAVNEAVMHHAFPDSIAVMAAKAVQIIAREAAEAIRALADKP